MGRLREIWTVAIVVVAACHEPVDPIDGHSMNGGCTLVGCSTGIAIHLGAVAERHVASLPLAVRACIDEDCLDATLAGDASRPSCAISATGNGATGRCTVDATGQVTMDVTGDGSRLTEGDHVVAVSLQSGGAFLASDTATVTVLAVQPNGPGCGPVCYRGDVTLSP
jgi:hypothetical protein